jgi:hypothetical protein
MCDGVVTVELWCYGAVVGRAAECKSNAASGPAPDSANIQKAMRTVCGLEHSLA